VALAVPAAVEVVHALPERLRLRVPALRGQPGLAPRFVAAGCAHPGVRRVRVNPACGSAVVECDAAACADLTRNGHVAAWLTAPAPAASPTAPTDRATAPPAAPAASPTEPAPSAPDQAIAEPSPRRRLARPGPVALTLAGLAVSFLGGGWPSVVARTLVALGVLPTIRQAARALVAERRPHTEQLDAAALALMLFTGDVRGAALARLLVALGEQIRERTARRTRRVAPSLDRTLGRTAWLALGTEEVAVPLAQVRVDDVVAVHVGEPVPVDGVVEEGIARLDQLALTGERRTVHRGPGDTVLAGSRVLQGSLRVRATAVGAQTRVGWVVHTLRDAPLQDTRAADYASHLADRLVPPTLALAGLTYAATRDLARVEGILIVDFATGAELSAPTSVLATTARAARDGVVVKSGRALERLATVDAVVLDKTGTLTRGRPAVAEVVSLDPGHTADEVLALAAATERSLRHLLAYTIVRHAERLGLAIPLATDVVQVPRLGVQAHVDGRLVRVGGIRFLTEAGIPAEHGVAEATRLTEAGHSLISVAVDDRLVGIIAYHDPARAESAAVIAWLQAHGIREIQLVTGDAPPAAHALARALGIAHVHASLLPDDKAAVVHDLQRRGYVVAMVGDGVDDAPALAQADVSISLCHGAELAQETADVLLLDPDLWGLVRAFGWAHRCQRLIWENLALVAVPNVAAVMLAALGRLSPVAARLLSDGSTLLAALNSLRPLLAPSADPRRPEVPA
jgi:P-type Cu2+ transporter